MTINALGATFDMLELDDKPTLTGMRISRGLLFNLWKQITGHYRWATGECRLRESTLAAEVGLSLPYIGAGLRYLVARGAVDVARAINRDGETVLHFSFGEALVQHAERNKTDLARAKAERAAGPNLSAKSAKDSREDSNLSPPYNAEPLDEPITEPREEASESAGARATPSPAPSPPPDPAPPPQTPQEAAGTAQPHTQAQQLPENGKNSPKGSAGPLPEAACWRPDAAGIALAVRHGAVDVEAEIARFQRHHDAHGTPAGSLAFRWASWCARIRPDAPARRPAPAPAWAEAAGPIIDQTGTPWEAAPKAADKGGAGDSAESSSGMVLAEAPADSEAWERLADQAEQAAFLRRVRGWGKLDWSPGLWAELDAMAYLFPAPALRAACNQIIAGVWLRQIVPGDFASRAHTVMAERRAEREIQRDAAARLAQRAEREARAAQRAEAEPTPAPVAASTRERARAEARAYAAQIIARRGIEPALCERLRPVVETLALARPVQASPGWGRGVLMNQAAEAVHMAATDAEAARAFIAACEIGNQPGGTPPATPWADAHPKADAFAVLDGIAAALPIGR